MYATGGASSAIVRQEAIRLLCRLLNSDDMKTIVVEERYKNIEWIVKIIALTSGAMTTRIMAMKLMAVLASSEGTILVARLGLTRKIVSKKLSSSRSALRN